MKVRFWGTRGSIPTPGPTTMKYGGNTSCVEMRAGDEVLIFDSGTGIRACGEQILKEFPSGDFTVHLFLSHTHWDHIQGFPFFAPAYVQRCHLNIYGPSGRDKSLDQIMRMQMDSDYFPVALGDMSPNITIKEIREPISIGNVQVSMHTLNHPAMCFGYRISDGSKSIVYATDHEPYQFVLPSKEHQTNELIGFPEYLDDKLVDFLTETDLYIAEAQYTTEEYENHRGWGHSPLEMVMGWTLRAHVRKIALYHHDPFHDDAFVDSMLAKAKEYLKSNGSSIPCVAAYEGLELEV